MQDQMQDMVQDEKVTWDKIQSLVEKSQESFQNGRMEEALLFNREALRIAMNAFQNTWDVNMLRLGVMAFRGVAVTALVTGRNAEGVMAIETGLGHAAIGLQRWPDAELLRQQRNLLAELKEELAYEGRGTVFVSEDLSSWPFYD